MTKWSRTFLAGCVFSISCLYFSPLPAQEATWVPIQGNILLADGTPLCAMVLANGQYMFSCDGAGAYDLGVPLNTNGQISFFSFADGFAPFSVITGPASFPFDVTMQTAAPDSPLIRMTREVTCSGTNRVRINGAVDSDSGQPLCAMVLASGRQMFSCNASQGRYDLDVPVGNNGQVTVFGFADGFQPYSDTFTAPECDVRFATIEGVEITSQVIGEDASGLCQLEVSARNTTSTRKSFSAYFDSWDFSGVYFHRGPVTFDLRPGGTDTSVAYIGYHLFQEASPCSAVAGWEMMATVAWHIR